MAGKKRKQSSSLGGSWLFRGPAQKKRWASWVAIIVTVIFVLTTFLGFGLSGFSADSGINAATSVSPSINQTVTPAQRPGAPANLPATPANLSATPAGQPGAPADTAGTPGDQPALPPGHPSLPGSQQTLPPGHPTLSGPSLPASSSEGDSQ